MDAYVFNAITIFVAFGALIVSLFFAVRQTRIMRQSNQLPVFIELEQEFRSERFQRAELYIMRKLKEKDFENGVLGLPDEMRLAVTLVQSYFGVLGSLIVYGIINEREAVASMGYRVDQLWRKLEPFILAERRIRGDDDFAIFFEDFVYRIRTNWPPEKRYNIIVHRLSALPDGAGAETVMAQAKRLAGRRRTRISRRAAH